MARLAELRGDSRYVADEIAAEMTWTPIYAGNRPHDAVALVERLPNTLDALACGELNYLKTSIIVRHTDVLTDLDLWSGGDTAADLRHHRSMRTVRQSQRSHRASRDMARGRAGGSAVGRPPATRVDGDSGGGAGEHAGRDVDGGELHGYGAITNDVLHKLADGGDVFWRRIVTDPLSGAVLDVGPRRRHTAAIGHHIRLRDKRCVFPECTRPAAPEPMVDPDHDDR